jgi:cell division protease FtsH
MVTDYGMADSKEGKELGRVRYSKNPANPHAHSSISPDTQKLIDREVVSLTTEAETLARDTLDKYNKEFENLAQALLKYETLDNEEIDLAMAGKPIGRPDPTATKTQKKTSAPKKGPKGPQPG